MGWRMNALLHQMQRTGCSVKLGTFYRKHRGIHLSSGFKIPGPGSTRFIFILRGKIDSYV